MLQKFTAPLPFETEGGAILPRIEVAYHTFGTLNADHSNVIWICHPMTSDSDVSDWWKGLFGPGRWLDPERYFIVCPNLPGSCYGSTGPLSPDPESGIPWYHDFPELTIRDMVKAQELLRAHLGIEKIYLLTGGSIGGQIALEWAIERPERFDYLILMATNARQSPWAIAFNETQRMAIATDPSWGQRNASAGLEGLKVARSVALLSYRHYHTYDLSHGKADTQHHRDFPAAHYQRYQGEKLARRFNAFTYWCMTKAMDSHHAGRGRGSLEAALGRVKAQTLVLSVLSDLLFPAEEQQFIARHIPGAIWAAVDSIYGHDGFLVETEAVADLVRRFMQATSRSQSLFLPLPPHRKVSNVETTL